MQMCTVCWVPGLLLLIGTAVCLAACPCSDPALCQPIQHSRDFEVYVFLVRGKNWKHYDWSEVTTVALFAPYDPELMCFAHSKGARYVLTGDVSVKKIVDPKVRADWIAEKVNLAKAQYMDGINLDIEQPVLPQTPEYYALTDLVKETTEAFHREIPGSQVTFDVAWSPKYVDVRCYNYSAIAELSDFLFVMSYDEQSQIWTECIAGANAPFNQTITGYEQFINISIDPKKLVMGVPWYGYDYVCLNLTEDNRCALEKRAFRGAPCSDAVGRQVGYGTIMKQVNSSLTGRLWNDEQKAPFYNYKDKNGETHQVWYDDPESIRLKAAYIKKLGLRGIGMWNGDLLDYSDDPVAQEQTKEMWKALIP
ncbi:PREDICTED: di-N-acetylchitobiase [Nanorana parkeri]|uniref:di-N-acetylchitobiase n=1 Tax=Nanorana parkeri TaxID=125878 RepID=UPI0008546C79|nr:PREDICTED: di-N-acetylchitobiase [Nanorana parkeri]